MSDPSILDFALRYCSPMPASFASELAMMSAGERKEAFDGIAPYLDHCRCSGATPGDATSYLRFRLWRASVRP